MLLCKLLKNRAFPVSVEIKEERSDGVRTAYDRARRIIREDRQEIYELANRGRIQVPRTKHVTIDSVLTLYSPAAGQYFPMRVDVEKKQKANADGTPMVDPATNEPIYDVDPRFKPVPQETKHYLANELKRVHDGYYAGFKSFFEKYAPMIGLIMVCFILLVVMVMYFNTNKDIATAMLQASENIKAAAATMAQNASAAVPVAPPTW